MRWNNQKIFRLAAFILMLIAYQFSFAQITASETSGCAPLVSVEFSHEFAGATGILWDFDDGTSATNADPTHTFQNPGVFNVTFTAAGGISESIEITVLESPTAGFSIVGDNQGCIPLAVQFQDESVGAPSTTLVDWSWDFGDGAVETGLNSSPVHSYSLVGINTVTLIVEDSNGCTGTSSVDNSVFASEEPTLLLETIPGSISVCDPPLSVSYDAVATSNSPVGTALEYEWDLGGGESSTLPNPPLQNYDTDGAYPVSVTVTDDVGCSTVASASAFIGSPNADWNFIGGPNFCDTVYFVNNSDPASSFIEWGDGDTWNFSISDTTFHVYNSPGDYSASITVSSPGCQSTSEVEFTIDDVEVSFTSSPNVTCEHELTVDFEAVSPNGVDFTWTFQGSQDTLYGENVSYTYSIPSNIEDPFYLEPETPFTTTLDVITAAGCPGSYSGTNDTIITPIAWFGVNSYAGCAPHSVVFSDSTLFQESSPIVSWQLHLGDGTVEDLTEFDEFTHIYNSPGEYEPFLIVENEFGCIDTSYVVVIEVGESTNADVTFSEVQVCPGELIDFETFITGGAEAEFWSIQSDGGLLSGCINNTEISSGFDSFAGMHDIDVLSHYNGCISEFNVPDAIEVLGPIGHLNVTAACETPFTVTCTGGITGADSWTFDFGDGNSFSSSIDQVVEHTYAATGDYTITLTSTGSDGCGDYVESYLVHIRDIEANLTVETQSPCVDEFLELSAVGSQDVYEFLNDGYLWSFGDGSGIAPFRTSEPTALVPFDVGGEYNLRLIVDDVNGCPDTAFVDIVVGDIEADIDFDIINACIPFEVDFIDNSSSNGSVSSWTWNFGDGNFSFNQNPTHFYNAEPGSFYLVELYVEDQNGCTDTTGVFLGPDIPSAAFFIQDSELCANENTSLVPFNSGYDDYSWVIEGFGNSSSTSPSVSFPSAGSYDVGLTVTNSSGCTNTFSINNGISVQEIPEAAFITNVDGLENLCYPILIEFTDVSTASIFGSREWDLGTGFPVVNAPTVGTIYDQPGTYTVSLEVTTTFGCTDNVQQDLNIEGPVAVFSISDDEICLGEDIVLNITDSSDVAYYSWDFGNGLDSANVSPLDYTYAEMPQNGSTFIQLISWSADSVCSATSQLPFQVNNTIADFDRNLEINLTDTIHCFGEVDEFTNTSVDANSWVWSFGDGEQSPDENPTHLYTDTEGGLYDITLEAYNTVTGCADTISKSITVYPQMVVSAPDQIECSYDVIQLEASGGELYEWTPGELLSDSTIFNPTVIDDENNVFTVLITDTNNCSESLDVIADYIFEPPLPLWTDSTLTYGELLDFQYPMEQYHIYEWTNQYGGLCDGCAYGFTPTDPDFYELVVTDIGQCFVDTFNFNVNVLFDLVIYVPNSFTPNNDGKNDAFYPVMNRALTSEYEFTIWDRYGRKIWQTQDLDAKWTGSHDGGEHFVQPEVYVWTINVSDLKSIPYEFVGTVTMVR